MVIKVNTMTPTKKFRWGSSLRKKAGESSKAAMIGDENNAVLYSCFLYISTCNGSS